MIKLNQIQKITMAAVMIVLTIIFTRLLSIQNIPVIPFVRISLGPAIVILASLVLGPFYGGIVGGAADILGIVMFNNTGYSINPILTIVYTLSGILPFFLYKLFKLIKSEKVSFIVLISVFSSLFLAALIFFICKSEITLYSKTYTFLLWHKIVVLAALALFTGGSLTAIYFINRSFKDKDYPNVYTIALTCLVSEFVVKTVINSFVKSYMFEVDILYMFMSEVLVLFINIPLYTLTVTYLNLLLRKIIRVTK